MSPRLIIFGALCLLQLVAAASGIARYERTLSEGASVLLAVAPVDPADPFRGRYVTLTFDLEQHSHEVKGRVPAHDEPVYVVLKLDAGGVAVVDYLVADRPQSGLFFKTDQGWPDSDTTFRVWLPFRRYYMNEALAPAADEAYRQAMMRDDGKKNYARVRLLEGQAVIEAVLLDGVPIERAARAYK